MNIRDYLTTSGSFLKKFFGYFKKFFDRDIYKTAVHPDEDWQHILVMFLMSTLFFIFCGIYFYFNIQFQKLDLLEEAHAPIVVIDEVKKIREAVTALEVSEKNLREVIDRRPGVSDPSL